MTARIICQSIFPEIWKYSCSPPKQNGPDKCPGRKLRLYVELNAEKLQSLAKLGL